VRSGMGEQGVDIGAYHSKSTGLRLHRFEEVILDMGELLAHQFAWRTNADDVAHIRLIFAAVADRLVHRV
jgi:hypothetical protein